MQEKFDVSEQSDVIYLRKALELAKIHRGFCAPNPSVGAVIVRAGLVVAAGYHTGPGQAHAEVDALRKLPEGGARGATIYITLEPCCNFGRTPPCTEAIKKAGLSRVVYGFRDSNPSVAGKGEAIVTAAGITCEHIHLPEINNFYASYQHWHLTKKPFITAKIALSLDGKIAGKNNVPVKITGDPLNELTHYSRKKSDAILTTATTIIHDDPQLNVRSNGQIFKKPLYVLDSELRMPATAKVFNTAKSVTIFHKEQADPSRLAALTAAGARCIAVAHTSKGLALDQVIQRIGEDGTHDLWIEAGGKCFAAFSTERLLQRAIIYIGTTWIGDGTSAFEDSFTLDSLQSSNLRWLQFGKDVMCEINLD
ncbi:MAG: bifunctional diaminohydroxyphosphoribosylaminopyrimidine deaminase/5-amino-6-(5-phosphoribosylamino)uracil reductase RibD [Pseudomonadota bacterium]